MVGGGGGGHGGHGNIKGWVMRKEKAELFIVEPCIFCLLIIVCWGVDEGGLFEVCMHTYMYSYSRVCPVVRDILCS